MSKAAELANLIGNINAGGGGVNRNLIINGAMAIDQRNGGSSYSQINSSYSLDRFRGNSYDGGATTGKFTVQRSSTTPDNFAHSLLVTSSAATSDAANNIFNIEQLIEGHNTALLQFGTSSAKTITLSFYVRSSLTGTFGGALKNNARNRNYPFTYTISSADTWEEKSITISGDTSGTWIGATNETGLWVSFGLGVGSNYSGSAGAWGAGDYFSATGATSVVGTNGATWYITGVQLEVGQNATEFEHEPFGKTLRKCQRYLEIQKPSSSGGTCIFGTGYNESTSDSRGMIDFKEEKRAAPSVSVDAHTNFANVSTGSTAALESIAFNGIQTFNCRYVAKSSNTTLVDGGAATLMNFANQGTITIDAEL